jgi:polyhydroxybutyrate depolymerase
MHGALLPLLLVLSAEPERATWQVDGLAREALVHASESTDAAPLVFVFHGHGGQMGGVAKNFHIHELWREAVVIYPQGVPTPGKYDPEGKQSGWQGAPGRRGDRDLKFFDAMLATMREKHHIDEARVYATGHSNGGGFTYLLWVARPSVLAAIAPSAVSDVTIDKALSLPVMHIAGESDKVVPFSNQESTMAEVRRVNHCASEGEPWAEDCLLYASETKTPFVSFVHPGGHQFSAKAPALIVRFFKEHARPPESASSAAGK